MRFHWSRRRWPRRWRSQLAALGCRGRANDNHRQRPVGIPYWLTEGKVAAAEAQEGSATRRASARIEGRHQPTESNLDRHRDHQPGRLPSSSTRPTRAVRWAQSKRRSPRISRSSWSMRKSTRRGWQGAAGFEQCPGCRTRWARSVGSRWSGQKGNYVELLGSPSDNNAATRSNGYETVLTQYTGLVKVGSQVANWDRTQGHDKMQNLLQAHPGHHRRDQRQRRDGAGRDRGAERGRASSRASRSAASTARPMRSPPSRRESCNTPFSSRSPCSRPRLWTRRTPT